MLQDDCSKGSSSSVDSGPQLQDHKTTQGSPTASTATRSSSPSRDLAQAAVKKLNTAVGQKLGPTARKTLLKPSPAADTAKTDISGAEAESYNPDKPETQGIVQYDWEENQKMNGASQFGG